MSKGLVEQYALMIARFQAQGHLPKYLIAQHPRIESDYEKHLKDQIHLKDQLNLKP
jgi:hypothetical protein